MKLKSAKGQIPFIELNGQQHADSGNIMRVLIKEYNLPIDADLNPKQIADATAYTLLLEESLFRAILYMRVQDLSWLFSADKGMLRNFTGVKKCMVSNFGPKMFKKQLQKSLQIQGMGRNSLQEVVEIMKRDLSALSTLLGDKPYFFGNKPTSFDATAFGQLAQVFYTPQPVDDVINFAEKTTPNLKAFVERIKKQYWPEWDEVTRTLSMDNGKSA
uniref:Glutathione S-transferase n=1 Tax=Panagrolaimus sp. JU765 TaxID=591449 RepID=A0AC34RS89_9BILA